MVPGRGAPEWYANVARKLSWSASASLSLRPATPPGTLLGNVPAPTSPPCCATVTSAPCTRPGTPSTTSGTRELLAKLDAGEVPLADPEIDVAAHMRAELAPHGRTRMTVFPLRRLVELKAATASSRVATVPIFVRTRPSRTRWAISPN